MEKRINWKETGMWVVRDFDGFLYISNRKPYQDYYDEGMFVWRCEGDFIKLDTSRGRDDFKDLKPKDKPVEVSVIDRWKNMKVESKQ